MVEGTNISLTQWADEQRQILLKNKYLGDYNKENLIDEKSYSITHKDAIADGDINGKGLIESDGDDFNRYNDIEYAIVYPSISKQK